MHIVLIANNRNGVVDGEQTVALVKATIVR
jgi:hypothetical protein